MENILNQNRALQRVILNITYANEFRRCPTSVRTSHALVFEAKKGVVHLIVAITPVSLLSHLYLSRLPRLIRV